jgi:hypothetical protein
MVANFSIFLFFVNILDIEYKKSKSSGFAVKNFQTLSFVLNKNLNINNILNNTNKYINLRKERYKNICWVNISS